jgi:hypothetical protein
VVSIIVTAAELARRSRDRRQAHGGAFLHQNVSERWQRQRASAFGSIIGDDVAKRLRAWFGGEPMRFPLTGSRRRRSASRLIMASASASIIGAADGC